MKRIEAVIPPETVKIVSEALMNVGVGGVTVLHGIGKSGDPKLQLLTFQRRDTLLTVVDDSLVDEVIGTIFDLVSKNSPSDGIVFVSPVEDAFYIGSRMRMIGTKLRRDRTYK